MAKTLFAASRSCKSPTYKINGVVNGIHFQSSEFSGTMNGQEFWDKLAAFAKSKGAYVELYS